MKLARAADVIAAIRNRFPPPAWQLFTGVANGTGSRARRWADAVAMGIWPSRGLELVGFEVKVSRSDFLRELKQPEKDDAVGRYCDRWWIAAGDPDIVKESELPPAWGLMVPVKTSSGVTMKIVHDAPKRKAKPIDRNLLAAILRRAGEHFDEERIRRDVRQEIYEEVRASVHEGIDKSHKHEVERLTQLWTEANTKVRELSEQLRISTESNYHPAMIGRAVDLLSKLSGWNGLSKNVEHLIRSFETNSKSLTEATDTMKEAKALFDELTQKDPAS